MADKKAMILLTFSSLLGWSEAYNPVRGYMLLGWFIFLPKLKN